MGKYVNGETVDVNETRKIGLSWSVAKNGRLRRMFRHLANPGSHKCVCGKIVSGNKAWEHVQACEIAQDEFKKARELVLARQKAAAEEAAKNDKQNTCEP